MRFIKYLACATMVARAENMEEEDDFAFVRALQGNGSNTTTTSTTTTSTNSTSNSSNTTTTTTTTSTSNTTTTTTTSSNTTTTTTTSGNTTTTTSTTTTSGNTTSGGQGQEGEGSGATQGNPVQTTNKADADMAASMLASLNANSTENVSTTAVEVVQIEVKSKASDPFFCKLSGETTGDCAATTTAAPTNSTLLRKLSATAAQIKEAHNVFCGAFSFAASFAVCSGMSDAQLVALFTPSVTIATGATVTAAQKNAAVKGCVTGLTTANIITGSDDCYNSISGSKGVCFANAAEIAAAASPNADRLVPGVKACTKTSGTNPAEMEFATSTDLNIPSWRTAGTGASAVTVDTAAIKATAETNAADTSNVELLQTALVLAAVEIKASQPAAAADVGVAAAIGLTDAQLDAVAAAVPAGGVAAMDLSVVTDSSSQTGALATAMSTAVTAVKASYTPTVTAGTSSGGSTSGATELMLGASVMVGFMGLVF